MYEKPVIVTAALCGGATPREKNEALPVTPEELAQDAYACWKAGAAVVHLHMRDEAWKGTMDAGRFRQTIALIRANSDCDVIINCSSSGERNAGTQRRMEHFRQVDGIEIGSYDTGTFNWGGEGMFENSPAFLKELGLLYQERGIKPECEIFDMGMLGNAKWLLNNGFIREPMFAELMLGVGGGMPATPEGLEYLVRHLPPKCVWSASGIGTGHIPVLMTALALGGNVRVGLEDNLYLEKGRKATNTALVERAVRLIREMGKTPATPAQARQMLGIPPLDRSAQAASPDGGSVQRS